MASAQPTIDMPKALRHLRRVPGAMAGLIKRHGAPDLARTRNSFGSLGRAIISQQLSSKAASTIYGRFLDLYPRRRFPTPSQVLATPVKRLRGAGLSGAKASYLLDLAAKYQDGTIQPRKLSALDSDAVAAMLCAVKGIGPWSVDMFLIFGLLRPDVLPVGDLGVRRGVQFYFDLDELPKPQLMTELTNPWRPYRSVASWYMWRVVEDGLP